MFDFITTETLSERVVSVEEAKTQCRVYDDYDLVYLESLIDVAQEITEKYLNRNILTSTCIVQTDRVEMKLPRGMANGVTEVTYESDLDDDGTRSTLDESYYNFNEITGSINLTREGRQFLRGELPKRFQVTFTTGWSVEEVPQSIKHAILILVSSWYENREASAVGSGLTVTDIPVNHTFLLDKYKINRIG